jgi:hypothetical protein
MALIIGKPRCIFCGEKKGVLHSVHAYGSYGEIGKRHFYHDECLQIVELEPEKFEHIMADRALFIHELKTQNMSYNKTIIKDHKDKIEKLQIYNFERLMPKV